MKASRVLFATNHAYLPQFVGGAEWAAHELARGLARNGRSVAVYAGLRPNDSVWAVHAFQKLAMRRRHTSDRRMGYPVYRVWDPALGLRRFLDDYRPDVVVIEGGSTFSLPLLAHVDTACPRVIMAHDVEFQGNEGHLRTLAKVPFVANSSFTAHRLKEICGIDADIMHPIVLPERCHVRRPGDKVVMVNPTAVKGVETALALAERRPDVPFVFQDSWGGDSPKRIALKQRAARLPNIEWRAPVLDPRAFFSDARVLLAPSMWEEAWGRVVTEAHFSGIPVLASDRGALPESVGPGGVLVSHEARLEDWEAALSSLWDDKENWTAKSRAALNYSRRPEVQADGQVRHFESILDRVYCQRLATE